MTKVLDSFAVLAEEFGAGTLRVLAVREHAMDAATKIIQEDAKGRIGEYQRETGPFPAWEPLAGSTEADKARKGYPADAPLLRTGDMRDSIKREYSASEGIVGSQDPVARYQEFGTQHIPPRPFLGPAEYANRRRIHRVIGDYVVSAMVGGLPAHLPDYEADVKK